MNKANPGVGETSDLKSSIDEINVKINKLKSDRQLLIDKKKAHQQDLLAASKKMGWKEKAGGIFGGDKTLIKKVESLNEQIQKSQKEIRRIDKQINDYSIQITDHLKSHLKSTDSVYAKLIADRKIHYNLYKSSKHYYDFVKRAHQGVTDALFFASWNKLINHPEAKEKLDDFQKETRKYQAVVDAFDEEITDKPFNRVDFPGLIKFSSQEVAMASFQKLASQSDRYLKYADKYLTRSKKEILAYREQVLESVVGSR